MSETTRLLSERKAITPLWVVALFVSLTELVLGAAVTQTTGGIQIALTVFVIVFPTLIAGSFFITLWHKPYVFYPPTEFGQHVNVTDYVDAMQRKPAMLKQLSAETEIQVLTEKEVKAAGDIADLFGERLALAGLFVIYACSIAYSQKTSLDASIVASILGFENDDYVAGIIAATSATGLMTYTKSPAAGRIANITEMNEKLRNSIRTKIDNRIKEYESGQYKADEGFKIWAYSVIAGIENLSSPPNNGMHPTAR